MPPAISFLIHFNALLPIDNVKYDQKKSIKKSPNGLLRIFGSMGGNPVKIRGKVVNKVFEKHAEYKGTS
jgi:hypothetical protein